MHVPLPEGELEAGNMYYKKTIKGLYSHKFQAKPEEGSLEYRCYF